MGAGYHVEGEEVVSVVEQGKREFGEGALVVGTMVMCPANSPDATVAL